MRKDLELTHLDKLYWPKEKITKGELLAYYEKVAPWLLPHLKDRPESLLRFPRGISEGYFFQKNLDIHPKWIKTSLIRHEHKDVNYLIIQNVDSLLFAVNMACIEIHPFLSRVSKLHYPDYILFDLDPKGSTFPKVLKVAQVLHQVLDSLAIPNYCKTSGATGLHVAVPLKAKYTFEQSKQFALIIAAIVHERIPQISTLERSLSKRDGKVYIDCMQNNFGQTIAAPYSVRARPFAPVSTPLHWSEVKPGLKVNAFTIKTILPRLKKFGDLFLPVLGKGINLKSALKSAQSLLSSSHDQAA